LNLDTPITSQGGAVDTGRAAEARRQQALLAALRAGSSPQRMEAAPESPEAALPMSELLAPDRVGDRRARSAGLAVYLAHAGAAAERALAAAYPVLRAQVGEAPFAGMARAYRALYPPSSGDLGAWGDSVAAFLEMREAWPEHPWLPDLARLEWAVHRAHRADDPCAVAAAAAPQGVAGLDLLGLHGADVLKAVMAPGSAVLNLRWPVLPLWLAHDLAPAAAAGQAQADDAPVVLVDEAALAHAAQRLYASPCCEPLWVWRSGWTVRVTEITRGEAGWHAALLAGASLESALVHGPSEAGGADARRTDHCRSKPQADFDFAGWLHAAVQQGWLRAFTAVQPCA